MPPRLRGPATLEALESADHPAVAEATVRRLAADWPRSLDLIRAAAASPRRSARSAAFEACARAAPLLAEEDRAAFSSLAAAGARDAMRAVRRSAARLGAEAELALLARDPFFDVRLEALRSLARRGTPAALALLETMLKDEDPEVAGAAVDALARNGADGAARLAPWLADERVPPALRLRAVRALREEGSWGAVVPALREIASRAGPRSLRAAATAGLLAAGADVEEQPAAALLLDEAIEGSELAGQETAVEGLAALGAKGEPAIRAALLRRPMPRQAFRMLLSALAPPSRAEAPLILLALFEELEASRQEERAAILERLSRAAPRELAAILVARWGELAESARTEALRGYLLRDDAVPELCEKGMTDGSEEVRRLAFQLALRTPSVPTRRCIEAVSSETAPALHGEFLEQLSRRRPDDDARAFLLGELERSEPEFFEGIASALDVFTGDDEVVRRLAAHHDRVYLRQLEGARDDAETWRRMRRMCIRTVGKVGGARAVEFLRGRARAERAIDAELSAEAIRGLAALEPDDAELTELLSPPSLPEARAEAAIATARRGKSQGVLVLAKILRSLNGDERRRAFDALAEGRSPLRRDFLEILAVDAEARFDDESRADAIRDLATFPDDEALRALAGIAKGDRSTDSRLEAIHALGLRGGDRVAEILTEVGEAVVAGRTDNEEQILRGVTRALGNARSARGLALLLRRLLERPLEQAEERLVDPDAARTPLERGRRSDREAQAARALGQLGERGGATPEATLRALGERGLLALLDPTFLLDIAEIWVEPLPASAAILAGAAALGSGDPAIVLRAELVRAAAARNREEAAAHLETARALAVTGGADAAVARILGRCEPSSGRRPRVWLARAPALARAEALFAAGKADEAAAALEPVIAATPRDVRVLSEAAEILSRNGRAAQALPIAEAACDLAPEERSLCEQLAWIRLEAKDAAGALLRFRQAQLLDVEESALERGAVFGEACALAALGRAAESADLLREILPGEASLQRAVAQSPYLAAVRPLLGAAAGPESRRAPLR